MPDPSVLAAVIVLAFLAVTICGLYAADVRTNRHARFDDEASLDDMHSTGSD